MPTYRGTLMQDGQPLQQDLSVTLVDMNTGLRPSWRGSFTFPGDGLIESVPYELVLEDGRSLNITVDNIQRTGGGDCYATFVGSGDLKEPGPAAG